MNAWKTVALAGALVAAAGIGAAVAPTAEAQSIPTLLETVLEPVELQPTQVWSTFSGGRLGVTVREVNDDDVKRGRLGSSHGVVVEEVSDDDSPAQKAGFKAGDIVVEFDGERVRSVQQFTRLVQETPAGRTASAVVVRDGQKSTLTVQPRDTWTATRRNLNRFLSSDLPARVVTPRPPTPPRPALAPRVTTPFFESFVRSGTTLGVTLGDLSAQLAEYFGVKEGVLVSGVTENSAAAKAGVKAGDVITAVNGEEVKSPSDARRAIQRLAAGTDFTIDVVRDKKKVTLKGKTETRRGPRRIV